MITSEDQLLAIIDRHFERNPNGLLLGRGDDCAELPSLGPLALSTDLFLEDAHFRRSYFMPEEIGHKALAVNLSDLAAAGARPAGFSLGLICAPDLDEAWYERMFGGMAQLAGRYGLALSGGDISMGEKLGFSITVWGTQAQQGPYSSSQAGDALSSGKAAAPQADAGLNSRLAQADSKSISEDCAPDLKLSTRHPAAFLRRRAAPGERIFLIGPAGDYCSVGLARNGLLQLEQTGRAAAEGHPASARALLLPEPQVEAGLALAQLAARRRGGSSGNAEIGLMDLSDGLMRDLPRLLQGSGAELDFDTAILHPELGSRLNSQALEGQDAVQHCPNSAEYKQAEQLVQSSLHGALAQLAVTMDSDLEALRLALVGGDDYLLLGSAQPEFIEALQAELPQSSRLDVIGTVRAEQGLFFRGMPLDKLTGSSGFDHFSKA